MAVVFAARVEELAKQQLSRCLSACNILYIAYSLGCCPCINKIACCLPFLCDDGTFGDVWVPFFFLSCNSLRPDISHGLYFCCYPILFFNCLSCVSVCFQIFIVVEVSAIPFLLWESSPGCEVKGRSVQKCPNSQK